MSAPALEGARLSNEQQHQQRDLRAQGDSWSGTRGELTSICQSPRARDPSGSVADSWAGNYSNAKMNSEV